MQEIRNIALIAHVDHGKTTLVDRMIYQANLVRQPENLGQLILDNKLDGRYHYGARPGNQIVRIKLVAFRSDRPGQVNHA